MLDWNGATGMLAGDSTQAKELASLCRHPIPKLVGTRLDRANFDLLMFAQYRDVRRTIQPAARMR